MAGNHKIRQGEHVARLAEQYGFSSYHELWDHPENAALQAQRKNPNVLFPGDELYVPDREVREEERPTDQRHRFLLKRPNLKLRLKMETAYDQPLTNAACDLSAGKKPQALSTDGSGEVEHLIPSETERGQLILRDEEVPAAQAPIALLVGHLDPVDEVPGQAARLKNLGYYLGSASQPCTAAMRSAIEEFQCDEELEVDGICGPKTQARLLAVHGS